MSFPLPEGYTFQSVSNNGNTVTYARTGHSTREPKLAIFHRVIPVYTRGVWSKPSYDVRLVRGVLDADGNPVPTRINVGTSGIQWPMDGVGVSAAVAADIAEFATLMSGQGVGQAIFSQSFPSI